MHTHTHTDTSVRIKATLQTSKYTSQMLLNKDHLGLFKYDSCLGVSGADVV